MIAKIVKKYYGQKKGIVVYFALMEQLLVRQYKKTKVVAINEEPPRNA
jgi:hypothetical protein